jgi:hypothetical protein
MIAEIQGALGTVNTSVGLLKTLWKVQRDEEVRSAIFEIQNELLSLQTKLFDANARFEEQSSKLSDLKKQLDERDRWDDEAKKYDIFHPAEGMTVYRLRDDCNKTDEEIWVCPNCFGNRKISFLNKLFAGNRSFHCHACEFKITPTEIEQPRRNPRSGWMEV